MSLATDPSFEDRGFLQKHIRSILDFYEPRVVSPEGEFYQCYLDDGEIFDPVSKQLVGSSRFAFNYATAYRLQGDAHYLDWAKWGLKYLTLTLGRLRRFIYIWDRRSTDALPTLLARDALTCKKNFNLTSYH